MNQEKLGIVFSYISMVLSSALSIVIAPYMLKKLGYVEYGLYQTISSFIGFLVILDFGSGVTTTRYVSKYLATKNKDGEKNFLAMMGIINTIISIVILLIGFGLVISIPKIYKNNYSLDDIEKAKYLAMLYILNIVLSIYNNSISGIIIAYKKFAIASGINIGIITFRYLCIFIMLSFGMRSIAISLADIISLIIGMGLCIGYCIYKLEIKIKLICFDGELFFSIFSFSLALLLQTIVNQANNSVAKVLLGVMVGSKSVTIYSFGLSIYLIYGSLSGAIRSVMLPKAVDLVEKKSNGEILTNFVIAGGRWQFFILTYILNGFVLLGKEFIVKYWVGAEYANSWYVAIILMIPMLFVLSQNITQVILDALGKRMIRSIILFGMAILNIILTYILIPHYDYIGAVIATSISVIIGQIVFLNIYYKIKLQLNIERMFIEISHKTWLCGIISLLIILPMNRINSNIVLFFIKGLLFTMCYLILLYNFGMNKNEKEMIYSIFIRLRRVRK